MHDSAQLEIAKQLSDHEARLKMVEMQQKDLRDDLKGIRQWAMGIFGAVLTGLVLQIIRMLKP